MGYIEGLGYTEHLGHLLGIYLSQKKIKEQQAASGQFSTGVAWDYMLTEWAIDMLEAGYDSPSLIEAACGIDYKKAAKTLENIVLELGFVKDLSEITPKFIEHTYIEAYRRNYLGGCQLLNSWRPLHKKLNYPYKLGHGKCYYNGSSNFIMAWKTAEVIPNSGHIPVMYGKELEKFTDDFLAQKGLGKY